MCNSHSIQKKSTSSPSKWHHPFLLRRYSTNIIHSPFLISLLRDQIISASTNCIKYTQKLNTTKFEKSFYCEDAVFPCDYFSIPLWVRHVPLIIEISSNQQRIIVCTDIKFVRGHYNISTYLRME